MTANNMTVEPTTRTFYYHTKILDLTAKIFTDQTGRLPHLLYVRNRHTMLIYDYNSNTITFESLKVRSKVDLLQAYT